MKAKTVPSIRQKPPLNMTLLICIAVIFIATITSMLSTKKLYSPIENLINKMADNITLPVGQEGVKLKKPDEFSFIDMNIEQMILQNKDTQYQIMKMVPLIQQGFLKELLYKHIEYSDIEQQLNTYDIRLPKRYITVYLINDKEGKDGSSMVDQVLKEMFTNYYVIKESSLVVVISNYNENDINESDLIGKFKDYPLVIAQGAVYESVMDIGKSYSQAKYAYQYHTASEKFEYLSISDLLERDFSIYKLPAQFEEQYRNCVDLKEYDTAFQIICGLVDTYITQKTPCFYVERSVEMLVSFAEKMAQNYRIALRDKDNPQSNIFVWKEKKRTLEEEREYIFQTYTILLDFQKNNHTSKEEQIIDLVMQEIDEQYLTDLSLEEIAENFKMSYTYLSKLFKKQTGKGFVEYITRKRIEYSIELLRDASLSIDRISGMVGYTNTPTFIRNFKKMKGVSPGKYRTLL